MKQRFSLAMALLLLTALLGGCAPQAPASVPEPPPSGPSSISVSESLPPQPESGSAAESAPDGENEKAFTTEEVEMAIRQAALLTDHVVTRAIAYPRDISQKTTALSDREIYNFIVTLSSYHEEEDHPYHEMITIEESPYLIAVLQWPDVQECVRRLFGVASWEYETEDYDPETQMFSFSLEQGLPRSPYAYKDLQVSFQEPDLVTAPFTLTDTLDYIDAAGQPFLEYGMYQIVYRLCRGEGGNFLTFLEFAPVES